MTTVEPTEPTVIEVTDGDREIADQLWFGMPERTTLGELVAVAVATGREMGRRSALASVIASLEDSAAKAQRFTQQQTRPRSGTYDEGYESGRLSALALVRWMLMTGQETRERSNG